MSTDFAAQERGVALNGLLTAGLCRLAGFALLGMGIFYWARLIGLYDGELWRFDTMPIWWRIAASSLAVLYPVAGIGLWMVAPWGTVIWLLIAAMEVVMHLGFPRLFGDDVLIVGLHLSGLVFLAVLRVVDLLEQRRSP